MNKRPVETIMGIVVIVIAALFMYFAYNVSNLHVVKGYEVKARFLKVGGLNVGSDVRINGVKVGTIIAQELNSEDYVVDVTMTIAPNIRLSVDSAAVIVSDGLIGDRFIKIEPGKSSDTLKDGDVISNTKDFKTIEDMVGEIIFMVTDDGSKD